MALNCFVRRAELADLSGINKLIREGNGEVDFANTLKKRFGDYNLGKTM